MFAFNGDVQLAFDNEHHGFGVRVQLRALAAAFRGQLDDVLGEGFGKTGQRAGDDPHAHLVPERQVAGDDVTHHALGDDRIGFGEHGTVSQQLGLSRVPPWGAKYEWFDMDNLDLLFSPRAVNRTGRCGAGDVATE